MGQSWMDRRDWREGRIASAGAGSRIRSSKASLIGGAIFALVFNGLTWPSVYLLWSSKGGWTTLRESILANPPDILLFLIFLLFPIISLVFALRAIRGLIDWVRYGGAALALNAVPAQFGGQVSGSIGAEGLTLRSGEDILLRLECRATEERTSFDGTSISTRVEWNTDHVLSRNEVSQSAGAAMIPVHLPTPPSGYETGERVESRGSDITTFSWWLVAHVEPHHGWNAEFEIPVFRTGAAAAAEPARVAAEAGRLPRPSQNPDDFGRMSLGDILAAAADAKRKEDAAKAARMGPPVRPPSSRIVVRSAETEGVVIEYRGQSRWIIIFALIWLYTLPVYVIPFAYYAQSRVSAALGWLLGGLLVNGGSIYLLLRGWTRRLTIGPEWITVDCGLPLVGKRRRLRMSEAGDVHADPDSLAVARKGQKSIFKSWFFVAPRPSSPAEARWLGAEIERALARYR